MRTSEEIQMMDLLDRQLLQINIIPISATIQLLTVLAGALTPIANVSVENKT